MIPGNKIIFFLLLILGYSCQSNSGNKTSNPADQAGPVYQIPDTIFAPGGFRIGMTEDEILQMVKDNPGKYYTNPDQLLGLLHTRIDGRDYSIDLGLYKGKLNRIYYIQSSIWKQIDNPDLKEHYQNIYNLIAGLNQYREVEHTYKKKTDFEWPFSMDYKGSIQMAEFSFGKDYYIDNRFKVYLDEIDGLYSINFNYWGVDEDEPTLSKTIYFD